MFIKKIKRNELASKLLLLIAFIFIGFGPLLFFTTPHQFFHTSRFTLENNIVSKSFPTLGEVTTIKNDYIKSLMVYIYEPTTFFYPDHNPLFPPFLAFFFVVGVGYAFFVLKNYFVNILLFFLITLPFINSAITDSINADQRISPLFSISSIFVAIGITYFCNLVRNKIAKYIFIGGVILYLVWQVANFFVSQPANKNRGFRDYLSMHILYFLQVHKQQHSVCTYVSPDNYSYFVDKNQEVTKEQNQNFLPNTTIHYKKIASLYDNEVYMLSGTCPDVTDYKTATRTYIISCSSGNNFVCPVNMHYDMIFRSDF